MTCEFKTEPAADKPYSYDCKVLDAVDLTAGTLHGSACPQSRVLVTVGDSTGRDVQNPKPGQIDSMGFLPLSAWQATLTQLNLPLDGHSLGHYYDRHNDVAVLFFNAQGDPYFPMLDVIDEDDDIFVAIVDTTAQVTGLAISVQGCNRPPVEPNIYGSWSTAVAGGAKSTGERPPPPPVLSIALRAFGKCAGSAAGGPQLVLKKDGTQHTATIPVNPLYRLAIGVAFGYDATATRSFAVRTAAGDTVPRVAESDDRVGFAPVIFVSFYPVPRDFRKTQFFLPERIQLFVGMDANHLLDNLVIGAGYELTQGLNFLLGWRVLTKQPVLAEGSGLHNGSAFDGTTESLPIRERWEIGSVFVGAGLSTDLFATFR